MDDELELLTDSSVEARRHQEARKLTKELSKLNQKVADGTEMKKELLAFALEKVRSIAINHNRFVNNLVNRHGRTEEASNAEKLNKLIQDESAFDDEYDEIIRIIASENSKLTQAEQRVKVNEEVKMTDQCLREIEIMERIIATKTSLSRDFVKEKIREIGDIYKRYNCAYAKMMIAESITEELKAEWEEHEKGVAIKIANLQVQLELLAVNPEAKGKVKTRLPTCEVPVFTGNDSEWFKFRDTFETLINADSNLSKMEKYNYLRTYYQPSGENPLDAHPVAEEYYDSAWELVKDRHDNHRRLRNYFFSVLLNVKKISKLSSTEINRLYDSVSSVMTGITQLKVTLDEFVVYFVEESLDQTTLQDWLKQTKGESPTWVKMSEFLRELGKNLNSAEPIAFSSQKSSNQAQSSARNDSKLKPRRSYNAVANSTNKPSQSCIVCNGEHRLYQCNKFTTQMNRKQRYDVVKQKKLCVNCLTPGHSRDNCTSSSRCRECLAIGKADNLHHTLLHIPVEQINKPSAPPAESVIPNPTTQNSTPFMGRSNFTYGNGQVYDFRTNCEVSSNAANNGHAQFNFSNGTLQNGHCKFTSSFVSSPNLITENPGESASSLPKSHCKASQLQNVSQIRSLHRRQALLSTLTVLVPAKNGILYAVRALLDSGADTNFATYDLIEACEYDLVDLNRPIEGLNGSLLIVKHGTVATIHSSYTQLEMTLAFDVVPQISTNIPSEKLDREKLMIPSDVFLADPNFDLPRPVDLLLSNEVFMFAIMGRKISLDSGTIMLETMFGFIVGGILPTNYYSKTLMSHFSFHAFGFNDKLESLVHRFIDTDNVGIVENSILSPNEKYCEKFYQDTTQRLENGRYEVCFPKNEKISQLTSNYEKAFACLMALNANRKSDPEFSRQLEDYFRKMIESGMMDEADPAEKQEGRYISTLAVKKESSSTTKVRPVFHGSQNDVNGLSLNDCLYVGPTVQPESYDTMIRFREAPFVVILDIEKMYLQVSIHPDDRKYQKILWNEKVDGPVKHYQVNRLLFGLASSSFLATRTLNRIADDYQNQYPKAAHALRNCFVVDDGLIPCSSIEDGKEIVNGILNIFAAAKLVACKVYSNAPELLAMFPAESRLQPDECGCVPILGHRWHPVNDTIALHIKDSEHSIINKASVLSTIASIYDLTGLFGPVIFEAKHFLQNLTVQKFDWKTPIPNDLAEQWSKFENSLKLINNIPIKRCIMIDNPIKCELHGFGDASEVGYGSCVYVRSENQQGQVQVSLITSKSRVAPLKGRQSLARLELNAATLNAKLTNRITNILSTPINRTILWSDSMIALHWLNNLPSEYETYVANRISAAQEFSVNAQWRHIPGKDNPADIISRGRNPEDITQCEVWWNGPVFIHLTRAQWPETRLQIDESNPAHSSELRRRKQFVIQREHSPLFTLIENRFSRFKILRNVFVRLHRWRKFAIARRQARADGIPIDEVVVPITIEDLRQAEFSIVRILQKEYYPVEYDLCVNNNNNNPTVLPRNSKLLTLAIFMDPFNQVIRVGGRVKNADCIVWERRHPMLIPYSNFASTLMRSLHVEHEHPTQLNLITFTRQTYWPIKAKIVAGKVTRECLTCFRMLCQPTTQYQANLPPERVIPSPPFYTCSVDFTGAFRMRSSMTSNAQIINIYISVFKCMTTKAINMEIVSSLSLESFIMAFDRHIAVYGLGEVYFSDNATNFTAAGRELTDALQDHNIEIEHYLRERGIRWQHGTPAAPHAMGYIEAGVKTIKHSLNRALDLQPAFDFEHFQTFVKKIQADVNSRPISPFNDDPNNLEALTPGHFLIGRPMNARPERRFFAANVTLGAQFRRMIDMRQIFWETWKSQYLQSLQRRPANAIAVIEFNINDLVLLKDNTPPRQWKIGRIVQILPNQDNIVRSVFVRTSTGIYQRHVNYLVLIPKEHPVPNAQNLQPPGDNIA